MLWSQTFHVHRQPIIPNSVPSKEAILQILSLESHTQTLEFKLERTLNSKKLRPATKTFELSKKGRVEYLHVRRRNPTSSFRPGTGFFLEVLTMGVQFCDDCGSLLADSAGSIIICDTCGKNCKGVFLNSLSICVPAENILVTDFTFLGELSSHTMTSKSNNFPSTLRTRLTSKTQKLTAKDLENTRRIVRECTQCHAKELIWSEAQMRSADEGSTIFYRCPDCGHT